ncbi:hypothetical protein SKAU_G00111420 [Synaphobranchus kaupii]|uniref:Uncharacterized protein n=1 Tax=Synaphobranchus kaupii TaxID=118154 RepID=A0A9Q1G190_SYNKA|nr:hypothetical protein SKAU_G00111420 [Synaphobranchus kaupii]
MSRLRHATEPEAHAPVCAPSTARFRLWEHRERRGAVEVTDNEEVGVAEVSGRMRRITYDSSDTGLYPGVKGPKAFLQKRQRLL